MIYLEAKAVVYNSPEKSEKESNSLSAPPISEWVEDFLDEGNNDAAFFLIARVMELHLSEGLRLAQRFYNNFTFEEGRPLNVTEFLVELLKQSKTLFLHRDIFQKIYAGLHETIGKEIDFFSSAIVDLYREIEKGVVQKKEDQKNFPVGIQSTVFAERIAVLETYYGAILSSKLEAASPPEDHREEWEKSIIDAAESVLAQKNNDVSWAASFRINKMITETEERFEKWWNTEVAIEQEGQIEDEIIFSYSVYDALPKGATNIKPIAATVRGMVFYYELDGEKYHWFDGMAFNIDEITTNMWMTSEHFYFEGYRGNGNSEYVAIIDGREYLGLSAIERRIINDTLIVEWRDDLNEETREFSVRETVINGKVFPIADYRDCYVSDNYITVLTEQDEGYKTYVISKETMEIISEVVTTERELISIEVQGRVFLIAYSPGYDVLREDDEEEVDEEPRLYAIDAETKEVFEPDPEMRLQGDPYMPSSWYSLLNIRVPNQAPNESYWIAYTNYQSKGQPEAFLLKQTSATEFIRELSGKDDGWDVLYQLEQRMTGPILVQKRLRNINISDFKLLTRITDDPQSSRSGILVNHSPNVVHLGNDYTVDGYDIMTNEPDGFQIKPGTYDVFNGFLEALCVAKNGDVYALEGTKKAKDEISYTKVFTSSGTSPRKEHIAKAELGYILMVGHFEGLPVVALEEKGSEKLRLFYGEREIVFASEEDIVFFGNKKFITLNPREGTLPLAAFNATTGIVKEVLPQRKEKVVQSNQLSLREKIYLKLAQLSSAYLQEVEILRELKKEKKRSSLTRSESKLLSIKLELGVLLEKIRGVKKAYATKPIEKEFLWKYYADNPGELLNQIEVGLDVATPEFVDEVIKGFAPQVWWSSQKRYESRWPSETARQSSKGEGSGVEGFGADPEFDEVFENDSIKLVGGDAELQFLVGKAKGKVTDSTPDGVIGALKVQDKDGWRPFSLPRYEGVLNEAEPQTEYVSYFLPKSDSNELRTVRLLLQPDGKIDQKSIKVTNTDGEEQQFRVSEYEGYPIVEIPPNAVEVAYKDVKVTQAISNVEWSSYQHFSEALKEKKEALYEGLAAKLPLDQRIVVELQKYKNLTPLDVLIQCEQFCRDVGVYDFKNNQTQVKRNTLNAAETLEFARSRATTLALENAQNTQLSFDGKIYAGVCAESSLLLVAMLRRLGFLAGVTTEYRPKENGEYSAFDRHASVFVLWPANTPEGYQAIYLDGTFGAAVEDKVVPTAHRSLAERILSGKAKVVEPITDEELAAEKDAKATRPNDSKLTRLSKKLETVFAPGNAWEVEKIAQLENASKEEVMKFYVTLIQLSYSPLSQDEEVKSFKTANNPDERWQLLLQAYFQHKDLILDNLSLQEIFSLEKEAKQDLITKIMIELRKLNK